MKKYVLPSADGQDTARGWEWLTALSPILLMMVVNYRWSAVWAVVTAAAGYLAVTVLWQWLGLMPLHVAPALLCGVLVTCCLPASAPVWLSAMAGLLGGVVMVIPALVNRLAKKDLLSCPVYLSALAGFLAVRGLFADRFAAYSLPVMWADTDVVASATPLASLGQPVSQETMSHLFWGVEAGSMGGGPVLAVLFAFVYLQSRRRVSPLPAAAMVGTVALLSHLLWQQPLYGLFAGGTLLAAVLVGDEGFLHVGWKGRLVTGAVAGVVTVLCRLYWGVDGAAVGVLAAGVVTPILHVLYHLACRYVHPVVRWVYAFLCRVVPPLWQKIVGFIRLLREKFAKTEN